ncbi:MAG: chemotaxis response regulator protein-glutamate methylesterase [Kofleriaceae bacterium]|nr:chemotaxis response regulator protein-glutamate methylesterase [Kofleriaceae bacterium]
MPPIKAIVVDDSIVIRNLLSKILNADQDIDVVATAANGSIALRKIEQFKPDVIVLDVEMPVMNGLETLRNIRAQDRKTIVVMFSALTAKGADATFDALNAGADDYEAKPSNLRNFTEAEKLITDGLVRKIKCLAKAREGKGRDLPKIGPSPFRMPGQARKKSTSLDSKETTNSTKKAPKKTRLAPLSAVRVRTDKPAKVELVVIGVSTGGPEALRNLIPELPKNFPVPILVVQHMPAIFTKRMAERLDSLSPLTVREAYDSAVIKAGEVWIAAGDYHLEIRKRVGGHILRTHQGPKENFSRPAVDVLFRSAAELFGANVLATILTGMGEDGLIGCHLISQAGGQIISQDQATSVVWGMPGAVCKANLSEAILPLKQISSEIIQRTNTSRSNQLTEKISQCR